MSCDSFNHSGSQLHEKFQKWLSPPDTSTNHNIACKAHYKGTAAWSFQDEIFSKWKSSPSLLWIYGKRKFLSTVTDFTPLIPAFIAGSGKSVLWFVISALVIYSDSKIMA